MEMPTSVLALLRDIVHTQIPFLVLVVAATCCTPGETVVRQGAPVVLDALVSERELTRLSTLGENCNT